MAPLAPLQLLVFRHPRDLDMIPYEEAIARAFQGGREAGGYLASGEDLGVQVELFSGIARSGRPPAETLDTFCHTFVLVLVDNGLLGQRGGALWDWLAECWGHIGRSSGRHGILVVAIDERVGDQFTRIRNEFGTLQVLQVHALGERAIRPAMLALRTLHECRLLLASGVQIVAPPGHPTGYLRLFISHAKIDGLPLAYALKHQIDDIGWLRRFYDADDLPAGRDWQKELQQAVGASLIIMLRSDVYDSRYWCQQEVLWADEYVVPAVLVDARTSLQHPCNVLPFDRVPSARIPDGNLLRVLFLALREGLRCLHFMRRVEEMKRSGELPLPAELRVFSLAPSMPALLRACRLIAVSKEPASTPRLILYPDPPFRAGFYEAAHALVEKYAPGARLVTPNTLAATVGGKS